MRMTRVLAGGALAMAALIAAASSAFTAALAPTVTKGWAGLSDSTVSPPDPNGAVGPHNYIEIINDVVAIYTRSGQLVQSATLATLTSHAHALSDPTVLWDPDTQRFYYNVWDVNTDEMDWGFSTGSQPTTIPGSFCNYSTGFGYSRPELPDFPKLGQSKRFLMIGVNHYSSLSSVTADRSDLLWIDKPLGQAAIATCPAATSFLSGRFTNLRNQDGTQAFTPVPAVEDDVSGEGWIVSSSDIECPGVCGTGKLLTVHILKPSTSNPQVATLALTGHSITVPSFAPPVNKVPQKGTGNTLDPLDGRLTHAVAAVDPRVGAPVVWTGHTVNSTGNRTEFRWYEVNPKPVSTPSLAASGVVSDPSLYVFNGAMAPDRTVPKSGGATHGDSFVIGFSTASSTTLPADRMVSSVAGGPLSAFVLVHQSSTADSDFSCSPCRWGDYAGATSDPAASLTAATGNVWLTNEAVKSGRNVSWNWEATP
jgi:hypothetical protein